MSQHLVEQGIKLTQIKLVQQDVTLAWGLSYLVIFLPHIIVIGLSKAPSGDENCWTS